MTYFGQFSCNFYQDDTLAIIMCTKSFEIKFRQICDMTVENNVHKMFEQISSKLQNKNLNINFYYKIILKK